MGCGRNSFHRPRRNTRNQFSFNLKVCQRCLCLYSNLPAHLFNLTKCNKICHFEITYVSVRTRKRKQYSCFIKFKLTNSFITIFIKPTKYFNSIKYFKYFFFIIFIIFNCVKYLNYIRYLRLFFTAIFTSIFNLEYRIL